MNKKIIIYAIAVLIVGAGAIILFNQTAGNPANTDLDNNAEINESELREFSMTSFVETVEGNPKPQFSLKEITVNKGDTVRIKITVTNGTHDFKIDEYNVYADTQLNKEYIVEFVADQPGEFTYYCTKPGHRANGQWGTLKVIDR